MEISPAQRISTVKPYFFADLEKTIAGLRQSGLDIIRLDMGSPDLPPEKFIIDALVAAAYQQNMHGYSPSGGSLTLRSAFAQYYEARFCVELDPNLEVIVLIGSKEGLFNLSQVILNPGDLALVPDPCYPVYSIGATIAGADTFNMPLLAKNGFLPDLQSIPEAIAERAKLMWLNYPNNPTGAVAPYSFFEEVIAYGKQHQILIAHDAPYVDVCFDGYRAPSILQVPGAKDVAIEFNSLSKTYNMAGWRVGVAVGNPEVIRLLRLYKSQMDSSHFKPVMAAAEAALLGDQTWIEDRNRIYQERRDIVIKPMRDLGFEFEDSKASLYVWAKLPKTWNDAMEFCRILLQKTGVSITPGVVYGKSGEGYVRISLVTSADHLQEAMDRMAGWLKEGD